MSTKQQLRASAAPFAHLFGGARAAKAEGDAPKDDDKPKGGKKAKGAAAEEPEEVDETETVDPDEGVDGDPEPDLGDVEDPDDSLDADAAKEEDDADAKVRKAAKSGRKAERSRWVNVMSHSSAAGREQPALSLLASGKLDSRSIVATLRTLPTSAATGAPAARGPGLRDRMAAAPAPRLGADGGQAPDQSFGAQVKAAVAKARP